MATRKKEFRPINKKTTNYNSQTQNIKLSNYSFCNEQKSFHEPLKKIIIAYNNQKHNIELFNCFFGHEQRIPQKPLTKIATEYKTSNCLIILLGIKFFLRNKSKTAYSCQKLNIKLFNQFLATSKEDFTDLNKKIPKKRED